MTRSLSSIDSVVTDFAAANAARTRSAIFARAIGQDESPEMIPGTVVVTFPPEVLCSAVRSVSGGLTVSISSSDRLQSLIDVSIIEAARRPAKAEDEDEDDDDDDEDEDEDDTVADEEEDEDDEDEDEDEDDEDEEEEEDEYEDSEGGFDDDDDDDDEDDFEDDDE